MATKTTTTERSDGARKVSDQPRRFVGLYLAPVAALPFAWLIHLWAFGLSWGPVDFHPNPALQTGTLLVLGAAVVGMTIYAHKLTEHRQPALRWALVVTVAVLGVLFGWNVGTGPHYVLSGAFLILSWISATAWALPRLNVARQDPREKQDGEPGPWGKLGERLGKAFHPRVREQVYDAKGNLERTEIDVSHPGETTEPLHDVIGNVESLVGAPAGLSHAGGTDRADRSTMTILHTDPLKKRVPYGPPSHPGGSISDPIIFAVYKDGQPVRIYLGGGPVAVNPTGYIFMGTSRSGKTQGENEMLTEVGSRTDVVVLYLNRAKGAQDVRPVAPIIEASVITESDADYRSAYHRAKRAIVYRAGVLGEYGISAWSPRCWSNPPQRKANGDPIPMEPMPELIIHAGEADDVLDAADEATIFTASKGLSTGISTGWSLQRALTDSMPSALKENLGLRFCFGTGNWNAASFVMDEETLKSVDPSKWAAKFPGRFLVQGPGIDENRQPVYARTMGLAPGLDDDASIDEHNAAMFAEMLRRNQASAPRMARLDRGTAEAMGMVGDHLWWDLMAAEHANLRARLGVATATDPATATATRTANMTAGDRNSQTANPTATTEDDVQFTNTAIPDGAEDVEAAEVREAKDELTEFEGMPLYPADEDGATAAGLSLDDPLPRPPAGHSLSWTDPRPDPASRGEAIAAVRVALLELAAQPGLADPDNRDAVLFQVSHLSDRYRYKSRPWFSSTLSDMADGKIDPPPGWSLSIAAEFPVHKRHYRLHRVTGQPEAVAP